MISNDTISTVSGVAVIRFGEEFKLFSARAVPSGQFLFTIEGDVTSNPTRYSVQVGSSVHVDLPPGVPREVILDRHYWRFMNHSCEPSAVICGHEVYSLRKLREWDEITFDYNTTEYSLAERFECRCGTTSCLGQIRGFRYLSRLQRERLRPQLAAHLVALLDGGHPEVGRGRDGEA